MPAIRTPVVFDGHNDVLLALYKKERDFFTRSDKGHLDLPRAKEGGFGGGFFAVFIPAEKPVSADPAFTSAPDDGSLPPALDLA